MRHGIARIAIVDFDVHHGNGTQDCFYDDGTVLFCSSHAWPLYPGSGADSEVGVEDGQQVALGLGSHAELEGNADAVARAVGGQGPFVQAEREIRRRQQLQGYLPMIPVGDGGKGVRRDDVQPGEVWQGDLDWPRGRAAVVVPNGVLFGDGIAAAIRIDDAAHGDVVARVDQGQRRRDRLLHAARTVSARAARPSASVPRGLAPKANSACVRVAWIKATM